MTSSDGLLSIGKVGYDGDGVVESAWTTTAYSCDGSENTWGKGKIEIYTCAWRPVVTNTKKKNEEESATLPALTVEGDSVLDFCLERDSYDSDTARPWQD